jgi:GNAT superfamily N-acetyltransferase
MKPKFRRGTVDDANVLLAMMRDYYAFDGHPFEENGARAALLDLLREPLYGAAWLIFDDSTPVGYAVLCLGYSLEFLGRDAFLDELYLAESHRRRGWGTQVLDFVEDEARQMGVRSIHLEVVRANIAANAFYHKQGYADRDHFLMSKRLKG